MIVVKILQTGNNNSVILQALFNNMKRFKMNKEALKEKIISLYDDDLLRFVQGSEYIDAKVRELIVHKYPSMNIDDIENFELDCLIRWCTRN